MIKTDRQFEKNMRKILVFVRDYGISKDFSQDEMHCIEVCISKQYISGICTMRMANGRIVADYTENLRIEKAGLEFLNPKTDWKFIITATIAIISVLCNIIQVLSV